MANTVVCYAWNWCCLFVVILSFCEQNNYKSISQFHWNLVLWLRLYQSGNLLTFGGGPVLGTDSITFSTSLTIAEI